MTPPSHARVVIVGGGIAGVSTAYHLAKLGITDVVLLEQGRLTCGTTWHAAGLVGQTRANRNATRMSRYGIELYASLEAETGLATGWKQCGSVNVAKTPRADAADAAADGAREELRRRVRVSCRRPRPARRVPLLRTDDLAGARVDPRRRQGQPDRPHAVARQGRAQCAARGSSKASKVDRRRPSATAASPASRGRAGDERGDDRLRDRRQLRRPVGARVRRARRRQRAAASRPSISTSSPSRSPACTPDAAGDARSRRLHLLQGRSRRPGDGRLRAGGQAVERRPRSRTVRVPAAAARTGTSSKSLMDNAMHRTPCLETGAGQDAAERPRELHARRQLHPRRSARSSRGYFVCAGFNSAGIANAGGAGRLIAEWIVGGEPPFDLWDVDIRRFAPLHGQSPASGRSHRRDARPALRDALAARGARHRAAAAPLAALRPAAARRAPCSARKIDWERANYFRPPTQRKPPYTLDTPRLAAVVLDEQRALPRGRRRVRPDVVRQVRAEGPRRARRARSACARTRSTSPPGAWSTRRCSTSAAASRATSPSRGIAPDEFFIVTGSAQATRDFDWIERHIGADEHAVLVDVTSALFGALGDGTARRRAAADAVAATTCRNRRCPSRRRARSTSATRACAPRA